MFGIGPGELIVIILVALVVLGPEKLPAAARVLGRLSAELRHLSTEFQRTLHADDAAPPPWPTTRNEAASGGNAAGETPAAAQNDLSGSQEAARPEPEPDTAKIHSEFDMSPPESAAPLFPPEPDALENEAPAHGEMLNGQETDSREVNTGAANTGGANAGAAASGPSPAPEERGKT